MRANIPTANYAAMHQQFTIYNQDEKKIEKQPKKVFISNTKPIPSFHGLVKKWLWVEDLRGDLK